MPAHMKTTVGFQYYKIRKYLAERIACVCGCEKILTRMVVQNHMRGKNRAYQLCPCGCNKKLSEKVIAKHSVTTKYENERLAKQDYYINNRERLLGKVECECGCGQIVCYVTAQRHRRENIRKKEVS